MAVKLILPKSMLQLNLVQIDANFKFSTLRQVVRVADPYLGAPGACPEAALAAG
jgi:hypothetical protein